MLENLRALIELEDAGSFTKAAGRLYRTPSAVTRKVQRLETAFQATLLDRTTRPPRLTPAGKRLVEQSRSLVQQFESLKTSLSDNAEPQGAFRLGISHALADGTLVETVAQIARRFPKIKLRLTADLTSALFARLHQGELDAAVVLLPDKGVAPAPLQTRAVARDDMLIVAAGTDKPTWRKMATAPWILNPPGCLLRDALLRELARTGIATTIAVEIHDFHRQLAFVAAGHGLGLVPARFFRHSRQAAKLQSFRSKQFRLQMSVAAVQMPNLGPLQQVTDCLVTQLERAFKA